MERHFLRRRLLLHFPPPHDSGHGTLLWYKVASSKMITSITAKRHMETKVLMAIGWQVVCTALSGQGRCTMARRRSTLALQCLLQPTLLLLQLDSPVRRIVIFWRFLSAMDHPEILTAGSLPACLPWLTALAHCLGRLRCRQSAAAPFMTHSPILCFLHKFPGPCCHL